MGSLHEGRLKNARHEAFCWFYAWGNTRHTPDLKRTDPGYVPETLSNATQSYIAAGYAARGNAAAQLGRELLRRAEVQERILVIRAEAADVAAVSVMRWAQLLPTAQEAIRGELERAARDGVFSAQTFAAAKLVIDRAEGPLAFKFKDPTTGEERAGLPVFILGGE
jgi:hypothetical protein